MASSAINSQIWNAKAANVQNYDGSPIVASGAWTFKSSTNVTTFTVSDGGVALFPIRCVIGSSEYPGDYTLEDTSTVNGITGQLIKNSANNAAATAETFYAAYGNSWSIGMGSNTYATYGNNLVFRSDALKTGGARNVLGHITTTGAWTLGPAAGGVIHKVNGELRNPFCYTDTTASAANVYVDSNGGLHRSTSSLRYKKDIDYTDVPGISFIASLTPFSYSPINGEGRYLGFGAETVQEIEPRLVSRNIAGEPDGLHYANFVVPLVKAVQELSALVTAQQAQIDALRLLIKGV